MRNKTFKDSVEILQKKRTFQGYFAIDEYQLRHDKFEGGQTDIMTREIFERGIVAAVLPYDPVRRQVVLIEQFRLGATKDERSPWLLEVVAGVKEPGESDEALVHREAQEEAGIAVTDLVPIANYWVSPGGTTERVSLFCGKVDAQKASGVHGVDHEHEDILVHVIDIQDAYDMVKNGMVNNAPTIIALQWLELHKGIVWEGTL